MDSNPNYIKLARTEASHILSMLALIYVLQSHVDSENGTIPVFTDSLTVINYSNQETLNAPSTVLANDISIIYQIRHVLLKKIKINFVFTQPSRIEGIYVPTPSEALLLSRRELAMKYHTTPDALFPSTIPICFPHLLISLHYKGNPIVYDYLTYLQESERSTKKRTCSMRFL